ncbi:MAG: HD domain-containing protein [Pseudomonadota bacterium]
MPPPDPLRALLLEALRLKELPRAGWVRAGVPAPESVAAHSWGVAWLVLALCPPGVDRGRALALAVLHDLAEVRAGDLTPADGVPAAEKSAREARALAGLMGPLEGRAELAGLWREFEARSTPEARFVRACDKLDMALQAARYREITGLDLQEFVDSALGELTDEALRGLAGG